MHQLIFYPVGNGDTSQIILENGRRILLDYRHIKKTEDSEAREIDLKERLSNELKEAKRDYFDVVAFTHADADHIGNCTEFFHLEHAEKYQGEGRIKIKELWVPAGLVTECCTKDKMSEEFVTLRQEARFRLKQGKGIRVFSRPDQIKNWLTDNDIDLATSKALFSDAGTIVPGFSLVSDGVEFFVHSPFVKHVDGGDALRNESSLIFNVRVQAGSGTVDFLAVGDTVWENLEDIVSVTKYHKRMDRLAWDLFNIPHHCSYLALSDEKGATKTQPKAGVAELLLCGRPNSYVISSSKPIPDNAEAREQIQPPHIQARNCYEHYLEKVSGAAFLVTMEEPTIGRPEPIVFEIGSTGVTRKRPARRSAVDSLVSHRAPRAG